MTHVPLLGSNSSAGRLVRLDRRRKGGKELSTGRGAWESLRSRVYGPGSTEAELLVGTSGRRSRKWSGNNPLLSGERSTVRRGV